MTNETPQQDLVTLTHRVARISDHFLTSRVFFNALGRSLEFEPGTAAEPGAAQDVPACVAEAIAADPSLAPHFRVEPIPADGDTVSCRGVRGRRVAKAEADQPAE